MFEQFGEKYKQLKRKGDYALFEVTNKKQVRYEVIKIVKHAAYCASVTDDNLNTSVIAEWESMETYPTVLDMCTEKFTDLKKANEYYENKTRK